MSSPGAKRRKVRKGTRSCWECRRRKIKCQFSNEDDATCIGCSTREKPCISQEYTHESAPAPDRRLAQRLGRLEELMEKLVDQTNPDEAPTSASTSAPTATAQKQPSPSESDSGQSYGRFGRAEMDIFLISAADNAQRVTLSSGDARLSELTTRASKHECVRLPARVAKFEGVSKQLHALFPSHETLVELSQKSPGAKYVLAAFHSHQDQLDGKPEPVSSLTVVPDIKLHPAILAKRLIQLAICIQQMPPCYDMSQLKLKKSSLETMEEWVSTSACLVTSDDDFVGTLEGLEALILQSFYQSDMGQLRKAWMTSRRALNTAQLMGIDRKPATSIRSCAPNFDPTRSPAPSVLWFRINCSDRYLSLMLGLSIGSRDNSFATNIPDDAPHDKLGKAYAVIAGKIADRNDLSGSEAYALTQTIDVELENSYKMMDTMWWSMPDMAICCSSSDTYMEESSAIKIQIRHYSLLILLHLPYLLRDREQKRYEYNRTVCMQASRETMERFLGYRTAFTGAISGRHVDYSTLVAAMTLLLGHLGPRTPGFESQRARDRALAEKVQAKMTEMGALNNDRLCAEASDTIRELLPIVTNTAASGEGGERNVHLNIPFLGTVNINSGPTPPQASSLLPSSASTSQENTYPDPTYISNPPFSLSLDPPIASQALPSSTMDEIPSTFVEDPLPDFGVADWPGFTADLEDWALQGVDTTYWSMLNNSMS
ncbi:Fc.00g103560.m01.CDS01 [Cosmosporella sp. VM-42]